MQMQKNIQRVITDLCFSWRATRMHTAFWGGRAQPRATTIAMSGSSRHDTYQPRRRRREHSTAHRHTTMCQRPPFTCHGLPSPSHCSHMTFTCIVPHTNLWWPIPSFRSVKSRALSSAVKRQEIQCLQYLAESWMSPSQPQMSDSQSTLFGKTMM